MNTTHHRTPVLLISAITLLGFLPVTASAEWGIGTTLATTQSVYKNNHGKNVSVEGFLSPEYRGERLNFHQGTLSYELVNADKYAFDVLTTSKNYGYQAKDKNIFKGMNKRHPSVDMGVRLRANGTYLPVSLAVTKDVYKSKGVEVGLSLGGLQPSKKTWSGTRSISVAPVAGANWQSKKSVDYYYGVKGSEATATRKAYTGKSALTPFIGVEAEARLSQHFSITGGAKYKRLPSAISDSSITKDSKNDYQVNLGLTYWF